MKANVTVAISTRGPHGNLLGFSAVLTTEYSATDHLSPILIVQQDNPGVAITVEPGRTASEADEALVALWHAQTAMRFFD